MKAKMYQVDAFTASRFRGNPAAVCVLEKNIPETMMQSIAAEMNLSETAFVREIGGEFSLRWFTPANEVSLCGHATLATAHVLFNHAGVPSETITFRTASGKLIAQKVAYGIRLDFPKGDPQPTAPPELILDALGITTGIFEDVRYCPLRNKFLIRLKDEDAVKGINPDYQKMSSYKDKEMVGVIITARGTEHDFISRFFAPWVGVNEDPVTGSAHTVLAPYWSAILGKKEMRAYQASKRGGELVVKVAGERVFITGNSVTVFETDLDVS